MIDKNSGLNVLTLARNSLYFHNFKHAHYRSSNMPYIGNLNFRKIC